MTHYGLLGYPLTHSFSKKYFSKKFEREGIDAQYENFEIDTIDKLKNILRNTPNLKGLNVTIPYKEQVIPFLDELNEEARAIGAVNTIKIHKTEEGFFLKGYNSDTYGFRSSLMPVLKPYHQKALILGTGGASKAIRYVLNELGIETLLVSRRKGNDNCVTYSDLTENLLQEYLLIVNTTPLGTFPNVDTAPDIPYEYLSPRHLLYDLVYNPEITRFLEKGKARGASIKNGYDMLIGQAERSFEIWNSDWE